MHADASAARAMTQRIGVGKVRHLSTKVLWIQDLVQKKQLEVLQEKGEDNVADLATKIHPAKRLGWLRERMGLRSVSNKSGPTLADAGVRGSLDIACGAAIGGDLDCHRLGADGRRDGADRSRPSTAWCRVGGSHFG